MIPLSKLLGVGILLCLGVSGCAASARDDMTVGQSAERIGGQAGLEPYLEQRDVEADQSAERIGGQAGLEAHLPMEEIGADQ
jgi:hypothetical protein